jgi:excinuclease ABC subunit A
MDVIKSADWVIDLGPEGGNEGGYLVAEGTPEQIMKNKNSYTGQFLKQHYERQKVEKPDISRKATKKIVKKAI